MGARSSTGSIASYQSPVGSRPVDHVRRMLRRFSRPSPRSGRELRRLVPVLTLVVAVLAACGGNGASTKAFCNEVKELRKLGRDPASTEPADPAVLRSTIAGLRDLERSAP